MWAPLSFLAPLRQAFGGDAWPASRFVMEYAKSGVLETAVTAAGISQPTARKWLSNPDLVRAIHSCREWLFRTEGASTGYRVLMEIAGSEAAPAHVRVSASKTLLALGGHSEALAAQATVAGQGSKPLHDMTPEELERLISGAAATLSSLRRPVLDVPGEPDPPADPPDTDDPASLL